MSTSRLIFEEVNDFLSPMFQVNSKVRLTINRVKENEWEVVLVEGENDTVVATAIDAHRATVPFLRHVANRGVRILKADREALGQWSVWAQAGVPERMHERGW